MTVNVTVGVWPPYTLHADVSSLVEDLDILRAHIDARPHKTPLIMNQGLIRAALGEVSIGVDDRLV